MFIKNKKLDATHYKLQTKHGFTLIELLVVIFIIGVLVSIILVSLTMSRKKARDKQRKTDLALIQNAIEMYYADNHRFPDCEPTVSSCATTWTNISDFNDPLITDDYMSQIPSDPAGNYPYQYRYETNQGGHYVLISTLENDQDSDYNKPLPTNWEITLTYPNENYHYNVSD